MADGRLAIEDDDDDEDDDDYDDGGGDDDDVDADADDGKPSKKVCSSSRISNH